MHLLLFIAAAVIIVLIADHFMRSKKTQTIETDAKTVISRLEADMIQVDKEL